MAATTANDETTVAGSSTVRWAVLLAVAGLILVPGAAAALGLAVAPELCREAVSTLGLIAVAGLGGKLGGASPGPKTGPTPTPASSGR
jgi:hypothetical protein